VSHAFSTASAGEHRALCETDKSSFTFAAYFCFAILGTVTTLLGAILPLLSLRWSISSLQAGRLFFWQFLSATIATLVSAWAFKKQSFKIPIVIGVALSLVGVGLLPYANWQLGRYCVGCYGLGLGLSLPTINLAVSEANPARRAASLSMLNFFWAAGAVGGPLLLLLTRNLNSFLALLSIALACCLLLSLVIPISIQTPNRHERPTSGLPAGHLAFAVILSAAFFLLVGSENAVSGWASSLALPQFSSAYTAAAAPAAFWTFFLLSRATAPVLLRKIDDMQLMSYGLACAVVGIVAFFLVKNPLLVLIACALAGLGIAPAVPVAIAQVAQKFGDHNPASTVCFAAGGIGAATMPALVGIIQAKTGIPKVGLAVPLIALTLVMIAGLDCIAFRHRSATATGSVR
jgi:fucose permease